MNAQLLLIEAVTKSGDWYTLLAESAVRKLKMKCRNFA